MRGARQMIFVTGEAGIGKTTVVDALVHRLAQDKRVWVARGQCIEHYGQGEAYMPVLEALEQLCRGPAGVRLVPLLRQHAPTWLVQMPGLLRESERERLQRQVLGSGQERRLRELAAALDVLTARQGFVLWLEDLQWSDVSTLDVLAILGRRQAPARLLVLGTYRPVEVLVRDHPLKSVKQELQVHGQCQELALDFLSEAAVEAYLARRFLGLEQDAGDLHRLAQFVHQRTDGNALFMVNMVEYLVRQGVLREAAGQWALHGQMGDVEGGVPESLQQMIERHFEQLPLAEQRLLEVASVAGVGFSTAAVAAGLETAPDTVEDGCEGLVRRQQFLRASGTEAWPDGTVAGRYRFRHALYHEVVYRRVAAGRRRRLHQGIGVRKEAGYGERASEIAAELALHFARGRDYGRAVRYYRQAGARARDRAAFREAVAYGEQALQALAHLPEHGDTRGHIEICFDLGIALSFVGEYGRSLAVLGETEALARTLDDRTWLGRVLARMATVLKTTGDHDGAMAVGQQVLEIAATLGNHGLRVQASCRLGQAYHAIGDFSRAAELLRWSVEAADRDSGTPWTDARLLSQAWLAQTLSALGAFAEGRRHGEEALRLATMEGRWNTPSVVCGCLGDLYLAQGDLEHAIRVFDQGLALCRASGGRNLLPGIAAGLGYAYALQGRLTEGRALLEEGISESIRTGALHNRSLWVAWLSEVCRLAGRDEEAWQHARQALDLARQQKEHGNEVHALYQLGVVYIHANLPDVAPAAAHYRQALALAQELRMRPLQAHCHLGLGTLYATTGQREQARAALTTAIALYRAMDMTLWLPQAEAALAQVA
jgi:tetratricopeptide (TPR) repeat protein